MAFTVLESRIFGSMFAEEEATRIFGDDALVNLWCEVEVALASAEAEEGVIPQEVARTIRERIVAQRVDMDRLRRETALVGYPILPLVHILEEMVGDEAGEYLHWGATTQDIMDTALALQLGQLRELVATRLVRLGDSLVAILEQYGDLPMVGRTHGQHAVPITFGLKLAVWLDELGRHLDRWTELRERTGYGQLSGAAGTLASLGQAGPSVRERMCRHLNLKPPVIGWHTARDVVAEVASLLGLLAGTLGKMAAEVATLQRNEIAEVSEGFEPGRGSSSTMPQKRNPITSEVMVAQAAYVRQQVPLLTYAMTAVHERATGEWQLEWIVLPEIGVMSAGLLHNACSLVDNLGVHPQAMRRNLGLTQGLVVSENVMMKLAPFVGRQEAHRLLYRLSARAVEENRGLVDVLLECEEVTRHLDRASLQTLVDPTEYLGESNRSVGAVVAGWKYRREAECES